MEDPATSFRFRLRKFRNVAAGDSSERDRDYSTCPGKQVFDGIRLIDPDLKGHCYRVKDSYLVETEDTDPLRLICGTAKSCTGASPESCSVVQSCSATIARERIGNKLLSANIWLSPSENTVAKLAKLREIMRNNVTYAKRCSFIL